MTVLCLTGSVIIFYNITFEIKDGIESGFYPIKIKYAAGSEVFPLLKKARGNGLPSAVLWT